MRALLLPLALCCVLAAPAGVHAAQHAHDHAHALAVQATPAQRWATDAPLREGMRDIRAAVAALEHYEHGHMGPAHATLLAERIEADVQGIFAACKLAPDADAALHVILARLLQGAGALKANPTDLRAIEPMREAVAEYGRQFDDPEPLAVDE